MSAFLGHIYLSSHTSVGHALLRVLLKFLSTIVSDHSTHLCGSFFLNLDKPEQILVIKF